MIDRLRQHCTYPNTVATLALFIALGGTSYALWLPRNSVGAAQLRRGAVGTRELRDHSIRPVDLNRRTRDALRGPIGRQGPAGPPAVGDWEVVSAAGGLVRGTANGGGHDSTGGSGHYTVGFNHDVSGCDPVASIGSPDTTTPPAGYATVWTDTGRVAVQTYNPSGTPTDLPFHLIVAC